MIKILPLLAVWIFAPHLIWMAIGSQLLYASRLARRQRMTTRVQRLIHTHIHLAPSTLS